MSSSSSSQRNAKPLRRKLTFCNCSSVARLRRSKRSAGKPSCRPSVSSTNTVRRSTHAREASTSLFLLRNVGTWPYYCIGIMVVHAADPGRHDFAARCVSALALARSSTVIALISPHRFGLCFGDHLGSGSIGLQLVYLRAESNASTSFSKAGTWLSIALQTSAWSTRS